MKRSYFEPFFAPIDSNSGSDGYNVETGEVHIDSDTDGGDDDGGDDDGGDDSGDDDGDGGDESGSDAGDEGHEDPYKDYVHKDQVSKIVSERVNKLNEKVKRADSAISILETISTVTGVPTDLIAGQLQEAAAVALANNRKISIEEARVEINKQIKAADDAKLSKALDLEKQEIQMMKNSDKFPYYEAYAEDIKETAAEKGVSLEDAYVLVTSRKKEVMDNYKKSTPQKNKAGEVNKNTKPKGGGAPKNTTPSVLKEIDKKASDGLTEQDILDYSDPSSSYDAMLKRQEKKGGK